MPWYEPATGPPPTPAIGIGNARRGNGDDDEERWTYPLIDHSATEDHYLYFDTIQHQVESQLAGIFPMTGFVQGGDYYSSTRNNYDFAEGVEGGCAGGQNAHPNVKEDEDGAAESKAAHFFHPRPVMALLPYKDFFSPLTFPADMCQQAMDHKPSLGDIRKTNNQSKQHGSFSVNADHGQQQQLQRHDTTFCSQASHANVQHQQRLCPGQELTPPEHIATSPTSDLKPKHLHNLYDTDRDKSSKNDPFKKPPKQSKLVQDAVTGSLVHQRVREHLVDDNGKAKTWDDYGGRPVDGINRKDDENKEATKSSKAKQGDENKKKKKSKSTVNTLDSFIKSKKRPSNGSHTDDGIAKGKRTVSMSKKQHLDAGIELFVPVYDDDEANLKDVGPSKLTEEDFSGIEQMEIQNAAQCLDGLQQFLTLVGRQKHIAFTTVFLDKYTGNYFTATSADEGGDERTTKKKKTKKSKVATSNKFTQHTAKFECTTPFVPSSKKYCTAKGPMCTAWNCTCDDQIRGMRASATLLGAMFVFNNKETNDLDNSTDNESGDDWQCFLLPLGPTIEEKVEYPRMSSWPIFPFYCNVSLSDRWSAFEALLLNETTKLVTYNATISLLPFYHHLDNDVMSQTRSNSLSSFSAYIAGDGSDQSHSGIYDGSLRSTWDLRLASWMLRPDAKDDELEFRMFQEGFTHLAPAHQKSSTTATSSIMQGLSQAKSNLELLHSLYPILNAQLVDGGLLDALECIETPVQSILACMESRGIAFIPDRLKKIEAQIETRIGELESQSRSITKDASFLLSSPQQVSHVLFDVLSLKMPAGLISKTTAGSSHRSTSEEAIQAIKDDMTSRTGSSPPIIDMILEFRQLNKLLTSFVRPLPKICRRVVKVPTDMAKKSKRTTLRRIYPQWMQTAVRTGRLSCRKPNLQQVPKEGAYGVVPRSAFATEEGMCLFACDYSQKEVRILAHMANDETMIALFRDDPKVDIYRQMSSIILNKSADAVTDGERSQFKIITLAILYGMSANQVATQLKISKNNAQQLMADFFRRFRRVKPWMDDLKAYARSKLYVKTISGRKRYLDDINSDDHAKRSQAERQVSLCEQVVHAILYCTLLIFHAYYQAINTVIQGSAADIMKTAMIHLSIALAGWQDETTRPRLL